MYAGCAINDFAAFKMIRAHNFIRKVALFFLFVHGGNHSRHAGHGLSEIRATLTRALRCYFHVAFKMNEAAAILVFIAMLTAFAGAAEPLQFKL